MNYYEFRLAYSSYNDPQLRQSVRNLAEIEDRTLPNFYKIT